MPDPARAINLLPATEFEESFWGHFLKWAVTYGRYIIILTELVVIIAFFSRFKLDNDLRSLSEEIEGQKNVLDAGMVREQEFRYMQSRLEAANKLSESQLGAREALHKIEEKVPLEVKLTNLALGPEKVTVSAVAASEQAMGDMLNRMLKEEGWKSLDIDSVTADAATGIKFSLIVSY